jgi:hypothetical protein
MLNFSKPDKASSSLAGALLIGMEGVAGLAFMLVLLAPQPDRAFTGVAGGVLVLLTLALWLRWRGSGRVRDAMSWVFSRKARPDQFDYQVQRRLPSMRSFGRNTPPSVDLIRDLKSGTTNNWAPSRLPGRSSKQG